MAETDILSVIAARHSVRAYRPAALPADLLADVLAAGDHSLPLEAEIALRFILLADGPAFLAELGGGLRFYGRILGAPHYIAAISERRPGYLTNAGFRMEQMILHATSVGLGACWLGGLYARDEVGRLLGVRADEQVVALTPLGYPAEGTRRQVMGLVKRFTPGGGSRKPLSELVYADHWGAPAGDLLERQPALLPLLEAARLAPSWVNSQPWRFVVAGDELGVAVTRPAGQNELPYYLLDGGIAMSHIFLAAHSAGQAAAWEMGAAILEARRAAWGVPARYDLLGILPLWPAR